MAVRHRAQFELLLQRQVIDVRQVARELGVRYLVQGSVRKDGRRIRISAQMVEAESGYQLWSERFDRPLDDVFALQDEIALNVVSAIEPSLRRAEVDRVRRKRPDSLDAYDLVLQAQPDVDFGMPVRSDKSFGVSRTCTRARPGLRAGAC